MAFEFFGVHVSVKLILTASSTCPLLVTVTVFSVISPGNQLLGDTKLSVYVVPYFYVLNSFYILVEFE